MSSEPTLKRLPLYYQYLKDLSNHGDEWISCTQIAKDLSLIPIQVRKDLEVTDIIGKPRKGYNINELVDAIDKFLSFDTNINACLVGAGNLGYALGKYNGFEKYGLKIKVAFDSDEKKIGKNIKNTPILNINNMKKIVSSENISIGILTAPAEYAQVLADIMVNSGIKAIWNFAPVRILVPKNVVVKHENLASSFLVLAKRLASIKQINE